MTTATLPLVVSDTSSHLFNLLPPEIQIASRIEWFDESFEDGTFYEETPLPELEIDAVGTGSRAIVYAQGEQAAVTLTNAADFSVTFMLAPSDAAACIAQWFGAARIFAC